MDDSLHSRLSTTTSTLEEVRRLCRVPSISLGVLHHDEVVYRRSIGYRDVENQHLADSDSVYIIASVSKTFVSAAVGILVDEGKLDWLDPIQKHVPDFNPAGDPNIGQNADIIDALRHSTGLAPPYRLVRDPGSLVVNNEKDYVKLLNSMPTANDQGQRFNTWWRYNNYAYSLIAKVVEAVSGQPYAEFVKERILEPLGMYSTAVSRADLRENIAYPYASPEDGEFIRVETGEYPCSHSPLLASTGMRSSVNDLLMWVKAVLSAERSETESTRPSNDISDRNPLRQMRKIRQAYWTRPVSDQFQHETAYCMGWLRVGMPSCMLGELSANVQTRDESRMDYLHYILGATSEPMLAIGHNGTFKGSTAAIYTFPETGSAVVALANGYHCGDASEFAAQIMTQALFNLQPYVDLLPLVRKERDLSLQWYQTELMDQWHQNRRATTDRERKPDIYLGEYVGFNDTFSLTVVLNYGHKATESSPLALVFNRRPESRYNLHFYKENTYSFFPASLRDYVLTMSSRFSDYRSFQLEFALNRTETEAISVQWLWNSEEHPVNLVRSF